MAITGIGQAISTSYYAFIFFAFLNAVGTAGVFPLAFIIGMYMSYVPLACSFFQIYLLFHLHSANQTEIPYV